MVSSEVQRTLVKSPPELWSELSDPAALARHLGEFGEIRITRLDPESAIEWESESASGEVLIKASGWGTRVTLRATRALLPEDDETSAEGEQRGVDVEQGSADGDAAPAGLDEQHHGDAEGAPAFAAGAGAGDGDSGGAREDGAQPGNAASIYGHERAGAPAPGAWASQAVPAAETWAAQLSEAASGPQPAFAYEHELADAQQILTHEHEPPAPDDPHEHGIAHPEPHAARAEYGEPERPGFFARLFRRRRRAPGEERAAQVPDLSPAHQLDDAEAVHGYTDPGAFAAAPDAERFEPADDFAPEDGLAPREGYEPEGAWQLESAGEAAFPEAPPEQGTTEHATETHALVQAVGDDAAGAGDPPAGAAEAGVANSGGGVDEERLADEQAAAEQVKAVLSSVLDHLGTAHHRPFSRG